MPDNAAQLQELADSAEGWMRGKIDDAEVDKVVAAITAHDAAAAQTAPSETTDDVTGTVVCAFFYWRITLDAPVFKHYLGNAGGLGNLGGGGLQAGRLTGYPTLEHLYDTATSFQFNSAAVGLNVNFFDKNATLVGVYIGAGLGLCLGTGGGAGSWS
jgi:hypothetical protein